MIFSAVEFVFLFLPLVCVGLFVIAAKLGRNAAIIWLVLASLVFYGWWDWRYLGLIAGSILLNFTISRGIHRRRKGEHLRSARLLLTIGILANIAALAFFKYFNFFLKTLSELASRDFVIDQIILPLAISFFTFQQVSYLVDVYRGKTDPPKFHEFALFVCYFPQLIAGPIVLHREVIGQFRRENAFLFNPENLAIGLTIFLLGLGKKVIIADALAPYADQFFNGVAQGTEPSLFASWLGLLAYTLQLYFDFSGYSDMAVGMGLMIGIRLPINFLSPYRSPNIIEFWRRWHVTLGRFLQEYVNKPIGGKSRRARNRYSAAFLTMVIGGIWHGAGWTFAIWGAMHGTYLLINYGFRRVVRKVGVRVTAPGMARALTGLSIALTFLCFILSLVLFRAVDLRTAWMIFEGLFGVNGASLPAGFVGVLSPLLDWASVAPAVPLMPAGVEALGQYILLILIGLIVVFCFRSLHEMSQRRRLVIVALIGALAIQRVIFAEGPTPFIYFQF